LSSKTIPAPDQQLAPKQWHIFFGSEEE